MRCRRGGAAEQRADHLPAHGGGHSGVNGGVNHCGEVGAAGMRCRRGGAAEQRADHLPGRVGVHAGSDGGGSRCIAVGAAGMRCRRGGAATLRRRLAAVEARSAVDDAAHSRRCPVELRLLIEAACELLGRGTSRSVVTLQNELPALLAAGGIDDESPLRDRGRAAIRAAEDTEEAPDEQAVHAGERRQVVLADGAAAPRVGCLEAFEQPGDGAACLHLQAGQP